MSARGGAADLAGLPRELGLWPKADASRETLLLVVGGLHGN